MASQNRIVLVGQLTSDPESRSTTEGLAVTKFRLAVNRPLAGGSSGTDLIDIVTWGKVAESCGQHLKNTSLALVEGRIQNRSFENQAGQRTYVTEVVASNVTFLDHKAQAASQPLPVSTVAEGEDTVEDLDLASDLPF